MIKPDVSKAVISVARNDPVGVTRSHNLKMLTNDENRNDEKHNDEKLAIVLLIVGDGLITYHFW